MKDLHCRGTIKFTERSCVQYAVHETLSQAIMVSVDI